MITTSRQIWNQIENRRESLRPRLKSRIIGQINLFKAVLLLVRIRRVWPGAWITHKSKFLLNSKDSTTCASNRLSVPMSWWIYTTVPTPQILSAMKQHLKWTNGMRSQLILMSLEVQSYSLRPMMRGFSLRCSRQRH